MAQLDTDFSDGDVLFAGAVTSTSNVNGITAKVNTKLVLGGADLTVGTYTGDTTETELASVIIPAGTFNYGAFILAGVKVTTDVDESETGTFRLKTGPDGSEVTRMTIAPPNTTLVNITYSSMHYFDVAATYSSEVSVIITGQMGDGTGGTRIVACETLLVFGY